MYSSHTTISLNGHLQHGDFLANLFIITSDVREWTFSTALNSFPEGAPPPFTKLEDGGDPRVWLEGPELQHDVWPSISNRQLMKICNGPKRQGPKVHRTVLQLLHTENSNQSLDLMYEHVFLLNYII